MKSVRCSIGFCARVLVDKGSRIMLKLFEDVLQKVIGDDLCKLNESEVAKETTVSLTMFTLSTILRGELCLN